VSTPNRCPRCGQLTVNARRDVYASGFQDGRERGFIEAAELRREHGLPPELADLWSSLLKLCHPDVHAPARQKQAAELTIALLEWRARMERQGGR
jgi:hypothetical protein